MSTWGLHFELPANDTAEPLTFITKQRGAPREGNSFLETFISINPLTPMSDQDRIFLITISTQYQAVDENVEKCKFEDFFSWSSTKSQNQHHRNYMADSNENYECDLERWRVRDTRYFQVQHFSKAIFSRILNIGVKSIEIHPFSRQNIISGENLGVNQIFFLSCD